MEENEVEKPAYSIAKKDVVYNLLGVRLTECQHVASASFINKSQRHDA